VDSIMTKLDPVTPGELLLEEFLAVITTVKTCH
jgi:plasmid maintenance system antidote protein VapI